MHSPAFFNVIFLNFWSWSRIYCVLQNLKSWKLSEVFLSNLITEFVYMGVILKGHWCTIWILCSFCTGCSLWIVIKVKECLGWLVRNFALPDIIILTFVKCFQHTPPWNLNLRNGSPQKKEPYILKDLDMAISKTTWELV